MFRMPNTIKTSRNNINITASKIFFMQIDNRGARLCNVKAYIEFVDFATQYKHILRHTVPGIVIVYLVVSGEASPNFGHAIANFE